MTFKKLILASSVLCSSAVLSFAAFEKRASRGNNLFEPDFLLILGCRVRGDKPEDTLQTRIETAADYLSKNKKYQSNLLRRYCAQRPNQKRGTGNF